jgi:vancomycin resistance protein YoaR
LRQQARIASIFRPAFAGPEEVGGTRPRAARLPAVSSVWVRSLWIAFFAVIAVAGLALAVILVSVRASHAERIFPSITVGDVPVGGMPFGTAASALATRADAIESSPITFSKGNASWTAELRDIGVSVDEKQALANALAYGREDSAYQRLRSTVRLARRGAYLPMPIALDYQKLDLWFDQIDRELGTPPHDATIEIQGSNVVIVPEVDGIVVDRDKARAEIANRLVNLEPVNAELPTSSRIATVRSVDLEPARAMLLSAMSHPVQVTNGGGLWTLPATDIAQFLKQEVAPGAGGARQLTFGLDQPKLAAWLEERLGAQIYSEPVDAVLGWDGEKVVSVEQSRDGVHLDAAKLAELVEGRFFADGGSVAAPLTYVKPAIDSANLGALGITTLLGSGQSNYSGSNDGRATNVAVGARLLNSTLVPPWGEFSFNGAIGLIDEEKGFVEWEPGLDASILQPTDDPATWADFKFENPSDSWMLVESWADGVNVVVNIYGADLSYDVESIGPTWGDKSQMLPPKEVVDDELDPGTVTLAQVAGIGEELSHYRVVRDRNGEVLWERSFYTKYFPRGDVWKVSPDMKGEAPIDTDFKFPPLPPAGVDAQDWVPGQETTSEEGMTSGDEWTEPTEEWTPAAEEWTEPAAEWTPTAEWTPPVEEWVAPVDGLPSG